MKTKTPTVKSNYNKNEKFSYDATPAHFESVTDDSIRAIKEYCADLIKEKYGGKYDAGTLYAMVRMVAGNFDLLKSQLTKDYGDRKSNLKRAQNNGIEQANEKLINFKKTVEEHDSAFELYHDNVAEYTGHAPSEKLRYSQERLEEFGNRLKKIEEKNHEA